MMAHSGMARRPRTTCPGLHGRLGQQRRPAYKRQLSAEIFCVALSEGVPLFREIIESEDRRDRTHRNASAAIDAFDGIDVKQLLGRVGRLVFFRMNAIHRARIHTCCVLGADARFSNHIGHIGVYSPGMVTFILLPRRRARASHRTAHSSKKSGRWYSAEARRTGASHPVFLCVTMVTLVIPRGHRGTPGYRRGLA